MFRITFKGIGVRIKGEAYQHTLDIYGNTGTLTWTVDSGSLPDGVTLYHNDT